MPKLRHVTSYFCKEDILKNGITFNDRIEFIDKPKGKLFNNLQLPCDSRDVNVDWLLDVFKPSYFPDWMEKRKCIYMTIYDNLEGLNNNDPDLCPYFNPKAFGFTLNSENLIQEKLFVNDPKKDGIDIKILNTFNKILDNGLTKELINEFRFIAYEFWFSLYPFNEYYNNPNKFPDPGTGRVYEVLYFDNIPPNLLNTINEREDKSNDMVLQQVLSVIGDEAIQRMDEGARELFFSIINKKN